MKRLVVVGSINLDLVVHCERVPNAGETVAGNSFAMHHGGKGANQAVAAARLGGPTSMIGCVGSDEFGTELIRGLAEAGVDTSGIAPQAGTSGIATIQVDAQRENRITVVAGANAALTPEVLAKHEAAIAGATMVLTQLETPLPTINALARLCTRHGVPLMLDPAPASPLPDKLLRQVGWLTPNLSEACALLGRDEPASANRETAVSIATELLRFGSGGVLLKLGASGLVLAQPHAAPIFQPAFPVQAVDTTAAGDACNAAFATSLLHGWSLQKSLRFAAAAAGLSVTRDGAQPSLPSALDVQAFLQSMHGS